MKQKTEEKSEGIKTFKFVLEKGKYKGKSYIALMKVLCDNPACRCTNIGFVINEIDENDKIKNREIEHSFIIDIKNRKIITDKQKQLTNNDIKFAESFISELKEENWKDFSSFFNKNRKNWRKITITPCHEFIQKRRKKQKTDSFKKEMKVRAQVEGTISEALRKHGLRYKKYRGEDGDQLQFYLTGAAINFKRFIKAIRKDKNNSQLAKAS